MVKTTTQQTYLGTITYLQDDPNELLDKPLEYHQVIVDVPGVFENLKCYPSRDNLDEPKVGDTVLVTVYDPIYFLYNTYTKLKENDFIGFRSSGKMVDITPDNITIGVFEDDPERPYKDSERPDVSKLAHLSMDSSGSITIHAAKDIVIEGEADVKITISGNSNVEISGDSKITVSGNSNVEVSGDAKIETSGNCNIKATGNAKIESSGNCDIKATGSSTIDSPSVTVKGGTMKVGNTSVPPQGFCGIPNCIFSGAPHTINQMPSA